MRLTEKSINDKRQKYRRLHNAKRNELANKLGQLEDIEEELGIDLITLFKALKNGYYYKRHNRILYSRDVAYALCRNELKLDKTVGLLVESVLKPQNNICVYVRDYGKTWALTKEELEK